MTLTETESNVILIKTGENRLSAPIKQQRQILTHQFILLASQHK